MTGGFSGIKDEIRRLKENLTEGLDANYLLSEVKELLCDLKEEMQRLKQNIMYENGGRVGRCLGRSVHVSTSVLYSAYKCT